MACESGWVPGITNGCYKFVTKPASWSKAEAACQNLSGALVTLDTETKAAFVAGYITFRGRSNMNHRFTIFKLIFSVAKLSLSE